MVVKPLFEYVRLLVGLALDGLRQSLDPRLGAVQGRAAGGVEGLQEIFHKLFGHVNIDGLVVESGRTTGLGHGDGAAAAMAA